MRSVRLEAGVEKNELHLKYELTFVVLHIGETFGDTSVQILSTETALVLFLKRTKKIPVNLINASTQLCIIYKASVQLNFGFYPH